MYNVILSFVIGVLHFVAPQIPHVLCFFRHEMSHLFMRFSFFRACILQTKLVSLFLAKSSCIQLNLRDKLQSNYAEISNTKITVAVSYLMQVTKRWLMSVQLGLFSTAEIRRWSWTMIWELPRAICCMFSDPLEVITLLDVNSTGETWLPKTFWVGTSSAANKAKVFLFHRTGERGSERKLIKHVFSSCFDVNDTLWLWAWEHGVSSEEQMWSKILSADSSRHSRTLCPARYLNRGWASRAWS